jgi:outer membrane lipoprotein-sorting protein
VLAKYSNGKPCMNAQQQGEATVANRAAYVIAVTPKPGGCAPTLGTSKAGPAQSGGKNVADVGIGQMLVWVDKQSFLPLKTEVRNPAGVLLERSEVTSVQYNVSLPDATFTYTPPPGATVSSFPEGTSADDVKRTIAESTAQPAKKP